jgi:hypothetical protein
MTDRSLQDIINTEAERWTDDDIEAIVRGLVEQSNQWNAAKAAGTKAKPKSSSIKPQLDLGVLLGGKS